MFTIDDYINSLKQDKASLVENLQVKGISASDSETFTTLVPKVLDITSVNNQSKSTTITTNGTTTITPDTGYTGLSSVEVTTNVEADASEYFTSIINSDGKLMIKKLPNNVTIQSGVTNISSLFNGWTNLTELPLIDTQNIRNFEGLCNNCTNLVNVPVLNTSGNIVSYGFSNMFYGCNLLTDISLDNILQMCINAINFNGTKTLLTLLGSQASQYYPTSRIQSLPHYQDFINAGWTIGY